MVDLHKLVIRISSGMGKRHNKQEKNRFLSYFGDALSTLGYPGEMKIGAQKKNPTVNLAMGDFPNTQLIISKDYNTRNVSMIPNYRYYPLNDRKNSRNELIDFLIRVFLDALLIGMLLFVNIKATWMQGSIVVRVIVNLVFLALFLLIMFGIPAPYNMNCNSATLATMFMIADDMRERKNRPAFVFADGMSLTTVGYKYVADYLKEKNVREGTPFVILSCIADGEKLYAVRRKNASARVRSLCDRLSENGIEVLVYSEEQAKNTVLEHFPNGMMILCGSKEGEDIAVLHTRSFKDTNADIEQLRKIADLLEKELKG
ncbi:MAG: hypothetical protein IIZ47_07390 [Erysipelotrichaceae bacterium]|nr:hypothetical protein [Erysipelotrichaceae bacterium]